MLRSFLLVLVPVTLVLSGCGETAPSSPASAAAAPAASPAAAGVHAVAAAPGSHEDWCGEHAVPETACTRCDPKLIPAFKATKDWCPEHGLPESQCQKCNPNIKIVRPPKPGGK